MFKTKLVFLLMILFIILSCEKGSNSDDFSFQIHATDTLVVQISDSDFYRSLQNHILIDENTTYLYRYDHLSKSLNVFNLTLKEKDTSIFFKRDGPNRIRRQGCAVTFYPLAKDRFLIANALGNVYITNQDSVMLSLKELEWQKNPRFYGNNGFNASLANNKIFMFSPSNYPQDHIEFKNSPLLASFDLISNEIKYLDIKYPPEFVEACWSASQFAISFTINNNQLVISSPITHKLWVYDLVHNTLISTHLTAQSKYITHIKPFGLCHYDESIPSRERIYLKSTPIYRSIVYDEYKNIYYRIIRLPSIEDPITDLSNFTDVMPFSIMVLDSNFNIMLEKQFKAGKFDITDFFITKEGLWISNNIEIAEDFDENVMSYVLFNVTPKE